MNVRFLAHDIDRLELEASRLESERYGIGWGINGYAIRLYSSCGMDGCGVFTAVCLTLRRLVVTVSGVLENFKVQRLGST